MASSSITFSAGLDVSPLRAGANQARSIIGGMASGITSVFRGPLLAAGAALGGIFGARAFVGGISGATKMGGQLYNLSRSTGIAAGELYKLKGIFAESDKGAEEVGQSIARMNKFLFAAMKGSKEAGTTMGVLELNLENIQKLKPAQQFQAFARAILQLSDPTSRAATAMQIFGRNGASLMPVFEDIARMDLSKLDKSAQYLEQNAKRFDELGDSITRAKRKKDEFFLGVTGSLIDTITGGTTKLEGIDALGAGQKVGKEIATVGVGAGVVISWFKKKLGIKGSSAATDNIPEMEPRTADDPWARFRMFKSFKEPLGTGAIGEENVSARGMRFNEFFSKGTGGGVAGSFGGATVGGAAGVGGSSGAGRKPMGGLLGMGGSEAYATHPDAYKSHPDAYKQTGNIWRRLPSESTKEFKAREEKKDKADEKKDKSEEKANADIATIKQLIEEMAKD